MITNSPTYTIKIVCKKCGSNLTNRVRLDVYHSCEKCDAWVKDVEYIKEERSLFADVKS